MWQLVAGGVMQIQWKIFGLRDALCILEFPDSWDEREREGVRNPDQLGKCRESQV